MIRFAPFALMVGLLAGCDRSPPPAPTTQSQESQQSTPPAPTALGPMRCDVSVVTPILPKRVTHLTIDPLSTVYFLQESDDGGDTLFVLGDSDVSSALPLSSRAVLAAMDEQGTGNIQSIAAGSDRNVYFYFTGGTNRKTVACLGRFETRTGVIRILARQKELADESDLGASLSLARGDLAPAGRTMWLWLHHTDAYAMFNVPLTEIPADGEISLPLPMILRSADGTLNPTRGDQQLSPGPKNSVLLVDTWTAALWTIDLSGKADVLQSLVALPQALSAAGANTQGDIAIFAAGSEPISARVEQRVAPVNIDTHYPSLLLLHAGALTPIPRDDLHADANFPLYTMQLQQLLYDARRDAWIGYDSASGMIVRLKVSAKRSP
jgi:hypothetical protein